MTEQTTSAYSASAYLVRRLTVEDAAEIPRLTLRVNGPNYINQEVYHPARLLQMNELGQLLSVVSLYQAKEIVGHAALERPDLGSVAECGEAMVLAEHRHHHLLDRMRGTLESEATRIGLTGIFGNAVTHHVFSQRAEEHAGAHPVALMLGASPAIAHIEDTSPQRVSLLTYFKFLTAPGTLHASAPAHHREMIERLYSGTGRAVAFGAAEPPSKPVDVETRYSADKQRANIRVAALGETSGEQIAAALNSLGQQPAAVYLQLPLSDPGCEKLTLEMERRGFFFCGVKLRAAHEGDSLILQRLNSPIDLRLLQIDGEPGRELVDYIARERQRLAL